MWKINDSTKLNMYTERYREPKNSTKLMELISLGLQKFLLCFTNFLFWLIGTHMFQKV